MDTKTNIKPKTMAEMLPLLSGIFSEEAVQTLTARKQPRQRTAQTRTTEKVIKPMTIAQMKADIQALKVNSPRRLPHPITSTKKRNWNSSVRVDKKISHTGDGQMKNNAVRKVLNFQPKPKPIPNTRVTVNSETPKFPKPAFRPKKSLHPQAQNTVRISGICHIPETPVLPNKPVKSRMTVANKENVPNQVDLRKKVLTPKQNHPVKKFVPQVSDTPLSNESWKSNGDASFLQREKEINDIEEKVTAICEEPTLENLAEVSPPVSTPFMEYRNVNEFFNNTSDMANSAYHDNTIMCFDNSVCNVNNKREESVIVSLCDMLNKATVNPQKTSTELDDLLEVEKQTECNIQMIENGIKTLKKIKESQLKSLQYVRKLISDKRNRTASTSEMDKTLVQDAKGTPKAVKVEQLSPQKSPVFGKPCSVIKSCSKSPSYKIPKKNLCMRKKVFYKSMPNVNEIQSPTNDMGTKALSMYMNMKQHMNFLNTPVVKHRNREVPDTPAVTSNNLQKQLNKLYGDGNFS